MVATCHETSIDVHCERMVCGQMHHQIQIKRDRSEGATLSWFGLLAAFL